MNAVAFERYVNFEFYKQRQQWGKSNMQFERYVNFEFYKQVEEVTQIGLV